MNEATPTAPRKSLAVFGYKPGEVPPPARQRLMLYFCYWLFTFVAFIILNNVLDPNYLEFTGEMGVTYCATLEFLRSHSTLTSHFTTDWLFTAYHAIFAAALYWLARRDYLAPYLGLLAVWLFSDYVLALFFDPSLENC